MVSLERTYSLFVAVTASCRDGQIVGSAHSINSGVCTVHSDVCPVLWVKSIPHELKVRQKVEQAVDVICTLEELKFVESHGPVATGVTRREQSSGPVRRRYAHAVDFGPGS